MPGDVKSRAPPDGSRRRRTGYAGPGPPGKSAHRYFFKLYALDEKLKLDPGVKKPWLEKSMAGQSCPSASSSVATAADSAQADVTETYQKG